MTFTNQIFERNADFTGSTFEEGVDFWGSTFKAYAHFWESTFTGYAHFWESTFTGDAGFPGSTFERYAHFGRSTFECSANFTRAIFKESADFVETTFKNTDSFRTAIFEKVIFLDNVKIKDSKNADILFRKAKVLWHSQGNYVEEGKAHYQEMDYIRKQKKWYIRYIWANLFHRLLHGYGEKPHRVILWAVAIVIACALLFMNFGIGETSLFVENLPT